MKSTRVFMFLLVFLTLAAGNAGADILWNQMELAGSAFNTNSYFGTRAFDDFSLSEDYQITSLAWHGGAHTDSLPAPEVAGFYINVYRNMYDASLGRDRPEDNPLYSRYVSIGQVTAGDPVTGTWFRDYAVDISADPFHASADVVYWLTIQADTAESASWWGWHQSSTQNLRVALFQGSGFDYYPINEDPFNSGNYDFAFRLEGSPVPLPGAVWLLGSGLLGMGAIRRRRRV